MTAFEFEQENALKDTDFIHISELMAYAIDVKKTNRKKDVIDAKETILDLLADILEKMLTLNIDLSTEKKLDIVHLLNKLKANKEYMQLIKGKTTGNQQKLDELYKASERMFKKSQSAFGND